MAAVSNPKTVAITSAAASVTVIANPSTTLFMYIWELIFTTGGTTNLTMNNATLSSGTFALTGAMAFVANGSFYRQGFVRPLYIIDPGGSFTITNSGSVQISGSCQYSN